MIKPPALPARFVDSPVTPYEAQQARAGVAVNGQRLQSGLTSLILLNILGAVLGLLAGVWLERALPELPQRWGLPLTPSEQQEFRDVLQQIPGWFWLVTACLTLLGSAINVWCLNVIRKAVAAVQRWTLEPTHDQADDLTRQAGTLRGWLTLGQWFPVITGVLTLLFYGVLFSVAGLGTGADTAETVLPIVFSVIASLIGMLPGALIAWLGLAAVKRWLDAVVTRTHTTTFPVRPFARSLDGWLIFALVLIILGLLNALAGTALLAFFPSFLGWVLENDATTPPDVETLRLIGNFMQKLAVFSLTGVLLYGLLALLVYWARNFANSVARLLDAQRPAQGTGQVTGQSTAHATGPAAPQDVTPSVPHDW
ncbi:hypothetical protein [Deinococcus fonticola]|uniref:hypothetical protein n=1 Tax=Deinococcus fonticola TaxID=2528713 RepID=UPI001074D985|nr:hypothetical protein [Deinococcus fonticola]